MRTKKEGAWLITDNRKSKSKRFLGNTDDILSMCTGDAWAETLSSVCGGMADHKHCAFNISQCEIFLQKSKFVQYF